MKIQMVRPRDKHKKYCIMEITPTEATLMIQSLAAMLAAENSNTGRLEFQPIDSQGLTLFTMGINWEGVDTNKMLLTRLRETEWEVSRLKGAIAAVKALPERLRRVTPPSEWQAMRTFLADLREALKEDKKP